MVTQNDKLKFIMEAAGEPWYNEKSYKSIYDDDGVRLATYFCDINPSPGDLNKLIELAEKLDIDIRITGCKDFAKDKNFGGRYSAQAFPTTTMDKYEAYSDKVAEALLNALFVAKGGLEDE